MNPITSFPWKPTHVAADALAVSGKGILHSIVVNGLTTAGDVTVYDSLTATGTILAIIHLDPTTSISVPPITLTYDIEYTTGLYFDYDATLVADLTVAHS